MFTTHRYLDAVAPFDFQQSLKFLGFFSPTAGEQNLSEQSLTKALRKNGETIAFRVQSEGSVENPKVRCTLFANAPISEQNEIYDRAAFFLSLEDDLTPFYTLADDTFQSITKMLYGYHQVKFLTPFECACWAVLSARNRMPVARTMKTGIIKLCGATINVEGTEYAAFPEPADVLSTDPFHLANIIGTSMRRTEYFISVAQAFITVDKEWLRSGDYDEVRSWLRGIKGIGEWASSFIMIRALGRMERLIVPERNLIEAASRLYGQNMTAEDVVKRAQAYGDYQAYWAHYIRASA